MKQFDDQYKLRHSAAHLLAHAVTHLFPGTLLTIGPVTDEGFFYDLLPPQNIKERDLQIIEAKMHELAAKNYSIVGQQVSKDEARKQFAHNKFKLEIIDTQIQGDTAGVYTQGDFTDLCAGGHTVSTGDVKYFKLTGISGSYWRADRNGQPLQRISGVVFHTQQELDAYFAKKAEAEQYDHRTLGKQLDLFSFSEFAPGMVFFHDRGTVLFNKLVEKVRELQTAVGYQEIKTPHIMNGDLWKKSGHFANYKQNMFITVIEDHEHAVKPMNCPGAALTYSMRPRSYRELPLRLAEFGHVHRNELSGVLHGLFRVRSFTQDDAHVYCMPDQITDEIVNMVKMAQQLYGMFGFEKVLVAVSTRPEKSMGTAEQWEHATQALKDALNKANIPFKIQEGEGAFYGPKLEMKIEDAMGREWQCGTVQVDYNQPEVFDLNYIGSDGSHDNRPVVLHRALLGSIERFIAVVLEHTKGRLPFAFSPEQVRVLSISQKQSAYAESVVNQLRVAGVRAEVDSSDEKISAKIKRAQLMQIPWMLVVGGQEEEHKTVTLRTREGVQESGLTVEALVKRAQEA